MLAITPSSDAKENATHASVSQLERAPSTSTLGLVILIAIQT